MARQPRRIRKEPVQRYCAKCDEPFEPTANSQKYCSNCTTPRGHARASVSFSYDEIKWLVQLMTTLIRGGDGRVLMRAPIAKKVYAKVEAMRKRINGV